MKETRQTGRSKRRVQIHDHSDTNSGGQLRQSRAIEGGLTVITGSIPPSSGSALTVKDEGTPLASDATSLDFVGAGVTASGTDVAKTIAITDEKAKVSANDTTPGYLNGKLVAGTNVTLTENSDGANETLTIAASGGGGGSGTPPDADTLYYTTGNITHTSTTLSALSGPRDLVVDAQIGDVISVDLGAQPNSAAAQSMAFDYAVMVGGSPVRYLNSGTSTPNNIPTHWYIASNEGSGTGGAMHYVVQSGDLSGGTITLRLYCRVSGSRTVNASSSAPLFMSVVNLGRPGSGGGGILDVDSLRYTAGDITCVANNAWENMPSVGTLTLVATEGDWIQVGVSFGVFNTTAQSISFDVGTEVSSSIVNHISSGAAPDDAQFGIAGWRVPASAQGSASGSIFYQLQSSDISSGTVTLRLRDHPEGSTDRVVNASTARPLHFWAINLGQVGGASSDTTPAVVLAAGRIYGAATWR